jgi:hypothetical protein
VGRGEGRVGEVVEAGEEERGRDLRSLGLDFK